MALLRKYWFDFGVFLSLPVSIYIFRNFDHLTNYQILMWLSLVSLFLHQSEEYRIAGTFPGMLNSVIYKSDMPDRYPLNTNTALYVNVLIGWTFYFLAAILAERAIWLGIATILVSVGNIIAHTLFFNIQGKTIYNPGLATCWIVLMPCVYFFILIIYTNHLASYMDFIIGIGLGILINVFGILKLIGWMSDKNTIYVFDHRNLLPKDRKKKL